MKTGTIDIVARIAASLACGALGSAQESTNAAPRVDATARSAESPSTGAEKPVLYVVGYAQERTEEAMAYAQMARGLLASIGPPGARARSLAEARLSATHASIDERRGKLVEAEATQRQVLALLEQSVGPESLEVARARDSLATALASLGRNEEAEAEHRNALTVRQALLGEEHPSIGLSRLHLCVVLFMSGKLDAAEPECVAGHRLS